MTMTITATFECADLAEFTECMSFVRDNEPTSITIEGTFTFDYSDMDLTPAHGIERISERDMTMNHAVQHYIAALVAWTREHITEGPISQVSDAQLRGAYDDMITYGLDTDIEDSCDLTLEQAQCIRGAFRDATAGMVPL